jgi:thiosulfate/3-mercaptopyruvate sulfurtransferase
VLFQIGDNASRPVYDAGHIPGSQFLNPFSELAAPRSDQPGSLYLELPAPAQLDSVLEAKGVSNDSWIVLVMAAEYFSPTGRTALTLEYAGLGANVSVLDGGLEAWKAAGKPVTTEVPAPRRGSLTLSLQPGVVVGADFVKDNLQNPRVAIIDSRTPNFYQGAETRQGRNGHIPGAANIPFNTVIGEGGAFKDLTALRAMFQAAGAEPGDRIVTYCHIGQQASLVWFAARLLGYDAALYDGSFQEWARLAELPVIGPVGK